MNSKGIKFIAYILGLVAVFTAASKGIGGLWIVGLIVALWGSTYDREDKVDFEQEK